MARLTCCAAVILLLGAPALAEQYWIAYEGNDFPEKQGWSHVWTHKPAKRWIEAGALVIDSRESIHINDYAVKERKGRLDPGPGEMFVMQWRTRVDAIARESDPGVSLFSDDSWHVVFVFGMDMIRSVLEPGVNARFKPGVFHDFEFRSPDMRAWRLYINGTLSLEGRFRRAVTKSHVAWGDLVEGDASLAHWDHFRFGVVPEPNTVSLCCFLVLCSARHFVSRT